MFVLSPALVLVDVHWFDLIRIVTGALIGMFLVASAVQGWLYGKIGFLFRFALLFSGLSLIDPGYISDLVGLGLGSVLFIYARRRHRSSTLISG